MNPEPPSDPPDEPHLTSEPHLLSPTSPKPIHFPAPASIPVLENMMDVGFNQTEAHMNDPAMHNTEVRPDFWRDTNEQPVGEGQVLPESIGEQTTGGAFTTVSSAHEPNAHLFHPSPGDAHVHPSAISTNSNDVVSQPSNATQPLGQQTYNLDTTAIVGSETDVVDIQRSVTNGRLDVQALLDSLQSAPQASATNPTAQLPNDGLTVVSTHDSSGNSHFLSSIDDSSSYAASGLVAPPSGLPPRPPPQETPLINQNYVHSQHIRDYHPHAAHSAYNPNAGNVAQGTVADPTSRNYVPAVPTPPSPSGNSHAQLQYQPSSVPASQTLQSPVNSRFPTTPQTDTRRDIRGSGSDSPPSEEKPWTGETQRKYDRFLEEERKYVSEGRWEQFPMGSRLFIGNLSSEKVTKRDVFHVFHHYGDLAQISIKQAYGFVQFLVPDAAVKALNSEQGRHVKDKKIHLEISKPQKNRVQNSTRRSRSPDHHKGSRSMPDERFSSGRGGDRDRERGMRDGYRPDYRSPSPRGYRDRRSDRHRSRSPVDYHRGNSGRYRSPSPRHNDTDDLPLPRRHPQSVPELQIIVLDSLERDFIAWVEKAFSSRGVSIDVLILSPRLSEQAVIRRQIVEGVLAVSRLTSVNQNSGKIPLQIFDRSGGTDNVKFEEYDNLDPNIAVELLLRARTTQQSARTAGYGNGGGYGAQYASQQQYGTGYNPQQPPVPTPYQQYSAPGGYPPAPYAAPAPQLPPTSGSAPPHLQNIITSLDPGSLQSLLSAMKTPQTANAAFGTPLQTPSSAYPPTQRASYPAQAVPQNLGQQQQAALAAAQHNPNAFVGYLQQQQTQQQLPLQQGGHPQAGAPVNMQDILARLGTYGKSA